MRALAESVGTFAILSQLWRYANTPRHPLVRFEIRHQSIWVGYAIMARRIYGWTVRIGLLIIVVGTAMEVFFQARISFMLTLFMIMLPLTGLALLGGLGLALILWQIPLSLAGSGMIVHERTAHTWDILLVTPLPRTDILLSKLSVGLSRLQTFITLATLLQSVPLIVLLGQVSNQGKGAGALLLISVMSLLFIVDRAQQFTLSSLLGLTASVLADSWPVAIVGSVALGTVLWMLRTGVVFGMALSLGGVQMLDVGQVLIIGLPMVVIASPLPWVGFVIFAVTLIIQERAVRTLFAWLVRRALG